MGKLVFLAFANIKKSISQLITLVVLIMISAFLLTIGLTLLIQYSQFFDERATELNIPHLTILQPESITTTEQHDYLASYPGLTKLETSSVLSAQGEYYLNGSKTTALFIFDCIDTVQSMDSPSLIGESLPLDDGSIYVPYIMKTAGGYEIGDDFTFVAGVQERSFTIAGFTEEITYGSLMRTIYRFYCTSIAFADLSHEFPTTKSTLYSTQLDSADESLSLYADYYQEFFFSQKTDEALSAQVEALPISLVKEDHTSIPWVMAILMIAFALILLIICLLAIRFRIDNSVEEDMRNIGALQAIGYTSRQISSSFVLQFFIMAFMGSILGIALAQGVLPAIALVLKSQSALQWKPTPNLLLMVTAFLAICSVVTITTLLTSRRLRKLVPLTALNHGIESHNFKRNSFPLETTRGPLSMLLAAKQIAGNVRQAAMLSFIIAAVTFAAVCGISIYYNVGVDSDEFMKIIVGETSDATLVVNDAHDTEAVIEKLYEDPAVRKVFGFQSVALAVDEVSATGYVVKDFSLLEGSMLANGRYPKHRNEVAIGGNMAEMLDKGIGDTVIVGQGGRSEEYYITGIVQMLNHSGLIVAIPLDGLRSLQGDYQFTQVYVFLEDGVDVDAFLSFTAEKNGSALSAAVDTNKMLEARYGNYGDTAAMIAALVLCVTFAVTILVFYTGMKTAIMRRKREIGIQKALGFTTAQFMSQIAFNYVPIILIGVVAGGLIGFYSFNPLFVLVTAAFGVVKTALPVPFAWVIATCAVMAILAYAVSLFVALRIHKVSPYALISE